MAGAVSAGAIAKFNGAEAPRPDALAAAKLAENGPEPVGVPEIAPETGFALKPGGKSIATNDVGVSVAVI
jgi:hypothetical protein